MCIRDRLGVDLHPELVFSMFQKSKPVAHIGLYQYVYLLGFRHFDILVTPGTFQMGSESENQQLFFVVPDLRIRVKSEGGKVVAKIGYFDNPKI